MIKKRHINLRSYGVKHLAVYAGLVLPGSFLGISAQAQTPQQFTSMNIEYRNNLIASKVGKKCKNLTKPAQVVADTESQKIYAKLLNDVNPDLAAVQGLDGQLDVVIAKNTCADLLVDSGIKKALEHAEFSAAIILLSWEEYHSFSDAGCGMGVRKELIGKALQRNKSVLDNLKGRPDAASLLQSAKKGGAHIKHLCAHPYQNYQHIFLRVYNAYDSKKQG